MSALQLVVVYAGNVSDNGTLNDTALARVPDPSGLAGFTQALRIGETPQQVTPSIATSPELLADHAGQGAAPLTSHHGNRAGRAPDPPSLQQDVSALRPGATAGSILFGIVARPRATTI